MAKYAQNQHKFAMVDDAGNPLKLGHVYRWLGHPVVVYGYNGSPYLHYLYTSEGALDASMSAADKKLTYLFDLYPLMQALEKRIEKERT